MTLAKLVKAKNKLFHWWQRWQKASLWIIAPGALCAGHAIKHNLAVRVQRWFLQRSFFVGGAKSIAPEPDKKTIVYFVWVAF
jgi:hypothetical protein